MPKTLIALSGGLDSATVLAYYQNLDHDVETVGFYYGSKHNKFENRCASALAAYYDVSFTLLNLEGFMKDFKSSLMIGGGEIPEGHYADESMKQTVVPGRNLIFGSILAGIAESRGCDAIALGVHAGDHAIYPDCRPAFITALSSAVFWSTEGKVQVLTPFLEEDKAYIVKCGLGLLVPYELTRTCYKDQLEPCGKCGSCVERAEAFAANSTVDPVVSE